MNNAIQTIDGTYFYEMNVFIHSEKYKRMLSIVRFA